MRTRVGTVVGAGSECAGTIVIDLVALVSQV